MILTVIYLNDSGINYPLCTQPISSFSIDRDFGTGAVSLLCDTGTNARLSEWLLL